VNTYWLEQGVSLLLVGRTDAPFPMIIDAGAVGEHLPFPHMLVEFLLAQTEYPLGLAESPAAMPLCGSRSIQSRQIL
jgi:hypothetical protein